jgi:hypothetical protein
MMDPVTTPLAAVLRVIKAVAACILLAIASLTIIPLVNQHREWPFAAYVGVWSAVVGWSLLWGVRKEMERMDRAVSAEHEIAVLRLALAQGGRLTAAQVARPLGWAEDATLATLRSLEHGRWITSTVTDEGVLLFEFPELLYDPARLPRPAAETAEPAAREPSPTAPREDAAR